MKKVMLIMMAILGMAWNANAQMCEITGNVEGVINGRNVVLHNYNSYMVTVTAEITLVNEDRSETKIPRTNVLKGESNKMIYTFPEGTDIVRSHVNIISVLKCATKEQSEYKYLRDIMGDNTNSNEACRYVSYELYEKNNTYYVKDSQSLKSFYCKVYKNDRDKYNYTDVSNYKYVFYNSKNQFVFFNF